MSSWCFDRRTRSGREWAAAVSFFFFFFFFRHKFFRKSLSFLLSVRTPGCPHSSFRNPLAGDDELPRESIEARAIVYYGDCDHGPLHD